MTLPPQPDSTPQRSATRAPIEVDVRVQFDDSLEVYVGRCYNISIGGLFLEIDQTRPHGSLVRFEVGLPEGSVRGLAEVVWSQATIPGRAGGLGLKFRFLEQRDRQLIFKLVSQHIKERLAQRPPLADEPPPSPNTPLARQRRASLLGEGLPSIPSPNPARVADRFASTPVADDLVVRTGAAELPILTGPPAGSPVNTAEMPTAPALVPRAAPPAAGFDERTWPSARKIDPSWLTPDPEVQPEEGPLTDLPLASSAELDIKLDHGFGDHGFGGSEEPSSHAFDAEAEQRAERSYFDGSVKRRAPSRRNLPWIVAPVLVALALLGYFLGARLWHRVSDSGTPEVLHIGQGESSGSSGASSSGQPSRNPALSQPTPAPPTPLPSPNASLPAEPTAEETPSTPRAEVPEPSTATPEPPAKSPEPTPRETPSAERESPTTSRGFGRVQRIRWEKIPDGVEVFIETDGPIGADRFDRFRLEGATPREVIRFYGVEKRFEQEQLTVGSIYLQQIRLGWHPGKPKGNELHVVLDVGNKAKIHQVRNLGRTLSVQVKKL